MKDSMQSPSSKNTVGEEKSGAEGPQKQTNVETVASVRPKIQMPEPPHVIENLGSDQSRKMKSPDRKSADGARALSGSCLSLGGLHINPRGTAIETFPDSALLTGEDESSPARYSNPKTILMEPNSAPKDDHIAQAAPFPATFDVNQRSETVQNRRIAEGSPPTDNINKKDSGRSSEERMNAVLDKTLSTAGEDDSFRLLTMPKSSSSESPEKLQKKRKSRGVTRSDAHADDIDEFCATRTSTRPRRTTQSYKEVKEHQKSDIAQTVVFESFHGFIETEMDALYAVEGTIHAKERFMPFLGNAEEMASVKIRSGTVIVMPENGPFIKRWRDGIRWSNSRAFGSFILYRQVEDCDGSAEDIEVDPEMDSLSHIGSTTGLRPTYSSKTLKPGTRVLKNGLTKRTISVKGSDGQKHRVVCYYTAADVLDMKNRSHHGSTSTGVSTINFKKREGGIFTRAVDDPTLQKVTKDSKVDMAGLLLQTFPDWKEERATLFRPLNTPVKRIKVTGAALDEGSGGSSSRIVSEASQPEANYSVSQRPTSSPTVLQQSRSIDISKYSSYYSEFSGYYPYRPDSVDFDRFKYQNEYQGQVQQPYLHQNPDLRPPMYLPYHGGQFDIDSSAHSHQHYVSRIPSQELHFMYRPRHFDQDSYYQ